VTDQIFSIERIQREAHAAARKFSDVNDACPYPFATEAGRVFRAAFMAIQGLCECNEELTLQELETHRCQCCGKAVFQ